MFFPLINSQLSTLLYCFIATFIGSLTQMHYDIVDTKVLMCISMQVYEKLKVSKKGFVQNLL